MFGLLLIILREIIKKCCSMSVRDFVVEKCPRQEIKDFVEEIHYSHNINGLSCTYCFKLLHRDKLIGASIFGKIAMAGVWKKYVASEKELIELRRLCCIDDTPKNTESFFIGKCIRWLRNNTTIKRVISYADLTYNHTGIIYQATNFKLVGQTTPGRVIMFNNQRYHDKTIRTYYNGKLKPFAKNIKDALVSGEAEYVKTKPKNIYIFDIKRRGFNGKEDSTM